MNEKSMLTRIINKFFFLAPRRQDAKKDSFLINYQSGLSLNDEIPSTILGIAPPLISPCQGGYGEAERGQCVENIITDELCILFIYNK